MFLTDELGLRLACFANLADNARWNAYEDWLRERGRDREATRLLEFREFCYQQRRFVMADEILASYSCVGDSLVPALSAIVNTLMIAEHPLPIIPPPLPRQRRPAPRR